MSKISLNLKRKDYEKKYKRMRIVSVALALILIWTVYINFDYIVFKVLIAGNYVYTDTLDTIYLDALGDAKGKGYFRDFDEVAIAAISEKIRETNNDRYTYLYTPQQYEYQKEYTKAEAAESFIEAIDDNSVYIMIPNVSKYTKEFIYNNKEELKNYKNIVIDLRGNGGGDISQLYKITNLFLEKDSIIATEYTRAKFFTKTEKSKGEKYFDFEKIIILQDSKTASASEAFIMALKENLDNVTVVGGVSYGKGIGQVTLPIKHGFAVKATVLKMMTPHNNSIHLDGITPDITYEGDDIMEYVRSILP